jgi:DNA polymerase-3 subunit epsilon
MCKLHRKGRKRVKFVAIDFETADYDPDSACSVALVRVEAGRIVAREHRLIRPPRRWFVFSYLHNIDWEDVEDEPDFKGVWRDLRGMLDGVEFLAAHNARFDERVLSACCRSAMLKPPRLPFRCTMQLARKSWGIYPTKLPDVCRFLRISLTHHEAVSDAEACARIVIAAEAGASPPDRASRGRHHGPTVLTSAPPRRRRAWPRTRFGPRRGEDLQ